MKTCILQLIAGCLLAGMVQAQVTPTSLSVSYVLEQTPRTSQTAVSGSSLYTDVPATVAYVDGLGRSLQTVQVRAAGNAGSDIISGANTYDAFGRPQKTYLPLPVPANGGQLALALQTPAATFYNNDQNPYAETVYESSPLARPIQQFGPGQAWRAGGGKPQSFTYGVATGVIRFKVNGLYDGAIYANPDNVTTQREYFGATEITCLKTRTEQGNTRIQYTDLQGRMIRNDVVLSSGETLTTAYVYDNYERLTAVIPPKLYQWFLAGPPDRSLAFLSNGQDVALFKETAYVYLHDKRGRVISKHIPGAGWTTLIYDRQDRLVMSQDQQDKASDNGASPRWRITKYDGLDRVILTGRISLNLNAQALDDLRTAFANQPITSEERTTAGGNLLGYTTGSFPGTVSITEADLLTVNYYDTAPADTPFTYQSAGAFGTALVSTIGQLTSSKVRNLDTQAWYDSRVWYDFKGRVIQAQSQNHLGGTDRVDTDYQFNGEVNQTVLRHQKGAGGPTTTVGSSYTYDHQGRPTQVSHAVDTAPPTVLATYSYDAIGRMQTKTLGGGSSNAGAGSVQTGLWTQGTTWQGGGVPGPMSSVSINEGHTVTIPANTTVGAGMLYDAARLVFEAGSVLRLNGGSGGDSTGAFPQTIDYSWHIRGGLRGLNLNASGTPDLTGGKTFAMKLGYEDAGFFDGHIGSQTWLNGSQPTQTRTYTYAYDGADRLTAATYGGGTHTVNGITYDANGNIQTMTRSGVDQLSYRYDDANQSNKLLAVTDAQSNTLGFADGNTTGDDYEYYPDGSLKKDLNRGITDIQYNLLKLSRQLTFSSGKVVSYQYDAGGRKLQMTVSGGDTRDYVGPFQYLNGSLFEIGHEEGRYSPTGGYEYFHKDHLGNVRVAFGASGITQYTDYDPWGLPLWGGLSGGGSTNRNSFNGKEELTELGSGLADFNWRFADKSIGRFFVIDRLAEKFAYMTPYQFASNDPVGKIELDGLEGVPAMNVGTDLGLWTSRLSTEEKAAIYTQGAQVQATGALLMMGAAGAAYTGGRSVMASTQIARWALSNPVAANEVGAGAAGVAAGLMGYEGNDIVPNASSDAAGEAVGLSAKRALSIATSKKGGHTLVGVEGVSGSTVWFEQTAKNLKGVGKLEVGQGNFGVVDDITPSHSVVSVGVSPANAEAAMKKASSMIGSNTYNSLTNSCVTCAKQVLQAGGVKTSPLIFTPKGLENYLKNKK